MSDEKLTKEEIGVNSAEKLGETENAAEEKAQKFAGEPDLLQDLELQLQAKSEELEQLNQKLLRLAADFVNYRKRTSLEAADIRSYANENLIKELLPVLDNYARALTSAHDLPENLFAGINMIYRQFLHTLQEHGLQILETVGKQFDPAYHEAFEQVETQEQANGFVLEEVQKGYLLHQKVLRPALVKVAKNSEQGQLEKDTMVQKEEEGKDE